GASRAVRGARQLGAQERGPRPGRPAEAGRERGCPHHPGDQGRRRDGGESLDRECIAATIAQYAVASYAPDRAIRMNGRSPVGSTSTKAPFGITCVMSKSKPEIMVKSASAAPCTMIGLA